MKCQGEEMKRGPACEIGAQQAADEVVTPEPGEEP
jgi:hypothetical protein